MVCNKCNQNIEDDSKFCSFCGNKIENNTNEIEVDQKDTNLKDEVTQTKMGFYDFYLNHKGSIGRKEFFFRGFLPLSIINFVLLIGTKITSYLEFYNNSYGFLQYVLFFISFFAFVIISNVTIKRLHDTNSKSWLFLLNLIPLINIILLLALLCMPSSKIRNHGQAYDYKLNSKKILLSIFNICIIVVLVFTFSFLNVLLKEHLNNNNTILTQNEILIPFKNSDTSKFGFVSSKGDWVIDTKFESADIFSDDLARVEFNGKYGFINKKGDFEIQPTFDIFTSNFNEGLAKACINQKCGFINKKGDFEIQPIFYFALADKFTEELASAKIDDKYGFIDKNGNFAIKPIFDSANNFSEGLALVSINNLYGFIDKNGNWAIAPIFNSADDFSEGLASITLNDKKAYIDKKGNIIFNHNYEHAAKFSEGVARFKINNKWGFIDKNGNILINPIFDFAYYFFEGFARVKVNDKVGFINKKGEYIIEPIYDKTSKIFYKGFAIAIKDKKHFLIDKKGNTIFVK